MLGDAAQIKRADLCATNPARRLAKELPETTVRDEAGVVERDALGARARPSALLRHGQADCDLLVYARAARPRRSLLG